MDVRFLGSLANESDFIPLERCSDGRFIAGKDGVKAVLATGDRKVEFILFHQHMLAYVHSALGYPAYYPIEPVSMAKPIKAVLMDLDGTSVRSESFWIWIIQLTTASLLNNPKFELDESDTPFVSGHSVSEHLQHCIRKYCPDKTLEEARRYYFEHTHFQMEEIVKGRGKANAFTPSPGLKEFLLELKNANIKIGLVTSGLYEKAWPEIVSAFRTLGMGDPKDFYDAIITAGYPLRKGEVGTLGELSPKPHPWLYAETSRVGLGLSADQRSHVVGIEDSGAGVCAIRLANFSVIGFGGGNIIESGTKGLCDHYCESFEEIWRVIR
ncbi:MAG: HAD family phosphatase [Planctomycetaceae bacterium]|nr:HAD family phosphatase [Planctomycetaceae bacterium]